MVNLAAPAVQSGPTFFAENRAWLRTPHGTDDNMKNNATLDVATFAPVLREGKYIPSGVVVAKITSGPSTGLVGLYDPAASDGRAEPWGLLYNTVSNESPDGRVFNAVLIHGGVTEHRLPVKTGPGALDDAAKSALTHIVAYA